MALKISNCFSNTCQKTRDPSICMDYCSAADMVTQDNSLDIGGNTFDCISQLCSSDCALPYANTDIFGIGVGEVRISITNLLIRNRSLFRTLFRGPSFYSVPSF
jgi:hypothetical protein